MTPDEILRKHEDANEMHFHEVDRKFIIEAMEEYAKEKSEKPINLEGNKTAVQWLKPLMLQLSCFITHEQLHLWNQAFEKAIAMEREQMLNAQMDMFLHIIQTPYGLQYLNQREEAYSFAEQYFTDTYLTDL